MPKLPQLRQNMQAHSPLPRGRTGGSLPRVNERGQEMDGDLRHTLQWKSLTPLIFTWSMRNHVPEVRQWPQSPTNSL